jgi:hypothetical protein
VVREGVGAGGRNDPNIVCTYELKKKKENTHHKKKKTGGVAQGESSEFKPQHCREEFMSFSSFTKGQ